MKLFRIIFVMTLVGLVYPASAQITHIGKNE